MTYRIRPGGEDSAARRDAGRHGAGGGREVATGRLWLRIAIVALVYIVAAVVGLSLVLPAGYTSPLWPAAGLALGVILLCGNRCWPGIWIGAFLVDLWQDISMTGALVAALLATGITFQALLGAWLTRRFIIIPQPLTRERDVWRFLMLGGPVACLVAATVSTLVLSGFDRMTAPDIQTQWLLWWSGDTLGVLLFTPIVLLVWPGSGSLWPRAGERVALPLLVTIALMAAGHQGLARWEMSQAQAEGNDLMDVVYENGIQPLNRATEPLRSLERFFASSEEVTHEEYATFNARLGEHAGILAVDWALRVPTAERPAFELTQQEKGLAGYRTFELDQDGRPRSVADRPEYYPVLHTAPLPEYQAVLGLDHGFETVRSQAMARAAANAEIVTVAGVELLRTRRDTLLSFQPIYEDGFEAKHASLEARREHLEGFIVGVFDVEALFAPLARRAENHRIEFRVTDVTMDDAPYRLAGTLAADTAADWFRVIEFTDRVLRVEMHPAGGYWQPGPSSKTQFVYLLSVLAACLITFSVVSSAGRQVATNAIVTERTAELENELQARSAAEERLAQATMDAEQANRAKSAFLATMSHEIRTPMNGVIGMVEILAHSRLSDHQVEIVRTIRESAGTLLGIIDDILDFSKIEAGRLEVEEVPVSVPDIVEGLCNSLVPVATAKGVDLRLFISPDIPERVLSDDVRLRQLLYNLVGNAIKFTGGKNGGDGLVSIRVEQVSNDPLRLSFRIADNGIGMKPETMDGLFTPFTQADIATTRRFGGTGLGLTICKRLVDMLHGDISAESTFGEGSVFTVVLPFKVADVQPRPALPCLSGLDCILVRDSRLHVDDMKLYLDHAGARVTVTDDWKSAVGMMGQKDEPIVVIRYADIRQLGKDAGDGTMANVRHLLITKGRRRRARVDSDNLVILDGTALRRYALLRAVAVAGGRASPEIFHDHNEQDLAREETTPPPTIAEARAQGRLILIAEDDTLNQRVIRQQLALLGYACEVSEDGVEALRLWREGSYGLLLTDLHMPEMDGYTLTRTIRQEERGNRRLPIIALTANALRGEASRARAAGIDAYLTKPVSLKNLRDTLEQWLPRPAGGDTPAIEAETTVTDGSASLDVTVLKGLVGDDEATVRDFLSDYLKLADELVTDLYAAIAKKDVGQVASVTHRLKSSSRSVGALPLGDLCAALESAAKTEDMAAVSKSVEEFDAAFEMVKGEIQRYLSREHDAIA